MPLGLSVKETLVLSGGSKALVSQGSKECYSNLSKWSRLRTLVRPWGFSRSS